MGTDWEPDNKMLKELEEFTCMIYSYPNQKDINKVRKMMIVKMTGGSDVSVKSVKKVDMSKVAPCRSSLVPHIRRVNYRVAQWKRSHLHTPCIPTPSLEHGWSDGEPHWCDGPILPDSLMDVVEAAAVSDDDTLDMDSDDDLSVNGSTYSSSRDI